MDEATTIGVDPAESVFQKLGVAVDGTSVFREKVSRPQVRKFLPEHPPSRVAVEPCAFLGRDVQRTSR